MIWHEVTFVYYKNGKAQAMRTATTETEGERPKSTRKYQKTKTTYTEWFPDERTADQAVEDFKEAHK